jgi:formamidopyrimidine-DNA glycosylase
VPAIGAQELFRKVEHMLDVAHVVVDVQREAQHAAPDGELGYFSKTFDVYGREGEPCRGGCGGVVKRIVQGGRSTFYCAGCQK